MSLSLSRLCRTAWTCRSCRQSLRPVSFTPIRSFQSAVGSGLNNEQPPPTAPKPQINIKSITQNVDLHTQNCLSRNYKHISSFPPRIAELYDEWIAMQLSLRTARERHNTLSGRLRSASPMFDADSVTDSTGAHDPEATKAAIIAEARALKDQISSVEAKEKALQDEMKSLALQLPNTTHTSTPTGDQFRLLHYLNPQLAPPKDSDPADTKSHTQIGSELELLDFSSASSVSGWGWYYLLNDAVLLEQALTAYALHEARKMGFKLVSPPSMVYSHMASACGFRPRDQNDEQQIYGIERKDPSKPAHVMAGTSEIPLAAMLADQTLLEEQLPRKLVGVSRCYRAEAGARGVESKGLYRVHEFTKVELFAWAPPPPEGETQNPVAEGLFDEMLGLQEHILSSLGLHCRVLEMPSADLGASAHRKIDIEAYIPSRHSTSGGPWGEVSSLSNCTDYQARRLATRVKRAKGTGYAWTLNGTALAVPRVMVALLENGYVKGRDGVGRVRVPEVLRWYMRKEWIEGEGRKQDFSAGATKMV